jgi:hypothetical protein
MLFWCANHYRCLSHDNDFALQANSAYNGIGIVKLMGRQSGFIAMHASLASGQVDVCLIPEVSSLQHILILFHEHCGNLHSQPYPIHLSGDYPQFSHPLQGPLYTQAWVESNSQLAIFGSLIFGVNKLSSKAQIIESSTNLQALNSLSMCNVAVFKVR